MKKCGDITVIRIFVTLFLVFSLTQNVHPGTRGNLTYNYFSLDYLYPQNNVTKPFYALNPDATEKNKQQANLEIICPEDISTYTDINSCNTFISDHLNVIFAENEVIRLTWEMTGATEDASKSTGINPINEHLFDEGTTFITYTITDKNNQVTTCSFTVTISDNQVPRLENMPGNITVSTDPGECLANVSWNEPTASDNCTPANQIFRESSARPGSSFPVGKSTVTYRAYDAMGNQSAPRSFTITVEDTEPPELILPADLTLTCGDNIPAPWQTFAQLTASGGFASDNCTLNPTSFSLLDETTSNNACPYTITRTYLIGDVTGNTTTAQYRIAVTGEGPAPIPEPQEIVTLKSGMAGTITAIANGPWNNVNTWDCNCIPAFDDDVIIPSTFTVTIDAAATCNHITVQGGGTLTSGGNHTLDVYGSWTNNGTFSAGTGTVRFSGNSTTATIGGSSSSVFNNLVINKGSSPGTIIETSGTGALSNSGTLSVENGLFKMNTGTFQFGGNSEVTIPESAGIWINGASFNSGAYSIKNEGLTRISSGTANFGTSSGNSVHTQTDGAFQVEGGTVNIAGRLENTAGGTLIPGIPSGITITGGTVTLSTVGNGESGTGSLDVTTLGAFNFTGGTIVFQQASTAGTAIDLGLVDGSGNGSKTTDGGTFQFGNASTPSGSVFTISSGIPLDKITSDPDADLKLTADLKINHLDTDNNTSLNLNGNSLQLAVSNLGTPYTFPIDNGSVSIPVIITFSSGTFSSGAYVELETFASKHFNNESDVNFLNRYWTVTTSGITNPAYTITATYATADVAGTETEIAMGSYSGTLPWVKYGDANASANTLSATGINIASGFTFTGITSDPPTVTISAPQETICFGTSSTLTANVTGDLPFTYAWSSSPLGFSGSSVSVTVTPSATTIYSVTVTDGNGFTAQAQITITVHDEFQPGAIASTGQTICYNENPAAIGNTTTASGGDGNIEYQWQSSPDGSTWTNISASNSETFDPSNLTTTTHFRRLAKDGTCNGFEASTGVWIVTVRPEFQPGAIETAGETICFGGTPSQIGNSSGATGGDGNISYEWHSSADGYSSAISGATSSTFTPPAGLTSTTSYRRYANDGVCNTSSTPSVGTWTVTVLPELVAGLVSSPQTICYNTAPAALVATAATGGSGSFTYQWQSSPDGSSGWANVSGATNLVYNPPALTSATWYRVVYTAAGSPACGTVESNSVQITVTPLLEVTATATSVACNNGTATVTLSPTGGTAPYSYTFNGVPDADGIINNVAAGTYIWSVTDAHSCGPVTGTIEITQPAAISNLSASVTSPITCNGGTGTVTLTASGGTGTLRFTFNGQTNTTGVFSGIHAGIGLAYSVTDDNNCGPVFGSIDVTEPPAISNVNAVVSAAILCNGGTATVTISATGGTAPLSYTFNGTTNSTGVFTGISAGTNLPWSVTDANNCGPVTGTLTVPQPSSLTASVSETASITCNSGTASLKIIASGGTGAKTYIFNSVTNSTGEFTGIAAGTYAWRVEDENSCFTEGTYEVLQPTQVEITSIGSNSAICQGQTLTLTSTAEGGTGNRTFNWTGPNSFTSNSPNPSIVSATPAASGTYTLRVTDANGCYDDTTTTVTVHPTPVVTPTPATQAVCHNSPTTAIVFSGAGSYTWTNDNTSIGLAPSGTGNIPSFTATNTGNTPVNATITVTPAGNGCAGIPVTATITVNPIPAATVSPIDAVFCHDATVNIEFGSNINGTTFQWSVNLTNVDNNGPDSGNGSSVSQTLEMVWPYTTPTAIYTGIPTSPNGCVGNPVSSTIEIAPYIVDGPFNVTGTSDNITVCPGSNVQYNLSGQNGGNYRVRFTYEIDNPNIGLPDMTGNYFGTGNWDYYPVTGNVSFTATNSTGIPQTGNIVFTAVTYWEGSMAKICEMRSITRTITVNPFDMVCPSDYTQGTDVSQCGSEIDVDNPTFTCPPATLVTWEMTGATIHNSSGTGVNYIGNYTFNVGNTIVDYSAEDAYGNLTSCSFTVTVTDGEAPVISGCPANQSLPMDAGQCGAVFSWTEPTATDNCGGSITLVRTDGTGLNSGSLFPAGTTTISYLATDAAGNTSTCSFDVTVAADLEAPLISCVTEQTVCAASGGKYTHSGTGWDATATENCGGTVTKSYSLSGASPGSGTSLNNVEFNVGTTTVTWTAKDISNNESSCSFNVVVNEMPATTIAEGNQTVCLNGSVTFTATTSGTPAPTYQWRKNGLDITGATGDKLTINPALASDAANYDVVVSNTCGNATSAPAALTVSTPPVITAQPASQTDCLGGSVEFSVAVSGGVTPYSYAWEMRPTSGDAWGPTGSGNSILTVADIGNTGPASGAEYRVTVTDNCGNKDTSSVASLTVNQIVAQPLDSATVCQGGNTAFSVTTSGTTPVSYQWLLEGAPLSNGGVYSGATSPTLTITNAQTAQNGTYSVNVTFNITQPNNNGAGATTCQMGAAIGVLTVDEGPDIVATPASQILCPGDSITEIVLTNANGTPGTTYSWTRDNTTVLTGISASGNGNISGTLASLSPTTAQTTTFTITATANGCVSTGTATVTVVDDQPPVVTSGTCPTNISVGAGAGICGAAVTYTPPTFDDNCDGAGLSGTLVTTGFPSGAEFPVGTTTVTWEYTDIAGNAPATCSFDVTVTDDVNPVAVCQDITVQLDASGNAVITANDVNNGSSDNCGTPSLSIDKTSFDCTNLGTNTVTLTVTDASGNTASCSATVTVMDEIVPTVVCRDITAQLDATGNVSISVSEIDNGSSDNCGIASLSLDKTDFNCTHVGANTVVLTATDNDGKTSTCNATVTIEDNIAPTALCKDITVQLDASGNATIAATDIDNGSTDNCGIASLDISQTTFNCTHAGNNTVKLTVTDVNGKISTCNANVTIEDIVNPVALCQNITVQIDASGQSTITPADVDNGSSDNCGTPALSLDKTSFDCTELGENTVTLTVTDGYGNTATCTAIVTVADDNFPVEINAAISQTTISCFGGTATVTINIVSGGVGALTYQLGGNSNSTGVFTNITAGSYSWSVSNPQHCGDTVSVVDFVVAQPEELSATIANTDVTCSSGNDGSITISNPSGGAGGYEYSIDGGTNWQASPSFTNLVPGLYHVMIRDANNCQVTLNAALEVYILTAVVDYSPVSCIGETDGSIDILNPAGGSGSYNYSINGGTSWQTSGTFNNLAPGTYDVRIQDAVETFCIIILNDHVIIDEPAVLNADLSFTDITCHGGSDGTITVSNPTGGFGTYEVSIDGINWFAVSTALPYTFTNLAPGSYTVQIRDEKYITCLQNLPAQTLGEPGILNATTAHTNVTCNGFNDGTINISGASGGSGNYEYSINGGTTWQAGNTFENLSPGTYNVQIRDASATGCVIVLNPAVEITEPPVPTVDNPGPLDFCNIASTSPIPLTGTPAGVVVFDITGGTAVGLADQTGVTAIPSFSTIPGTATITITPRVGSCTGTPVDVAITVAPLPTVTAPIGLTFCNGTLSDPFPLNGTPVNVRYDISGGASIGLADVTDAAGIPVFTPIAGTAVLTVTPKVLNCVGPPVSFTVTVRESPTATISGGATVCRGTAAPSVIFTNPHNAVIKVIYNINGAGNFTANIPAVSAVSVAVPTSVAGDFDYELVSAQYITTPECINPVTGIARFTILNPATPTITGPDTLCAGSTGNVYTTEPGMTNYIWSISAGGTITGGGTGTDNTITITWNTHGAKNVSVRYTDTNSCTGSTSTTFPVTVNPLPTVTITGPVSVCVNSEPRVYNTQPGMTNYTWNISTGGTITAGGGTNDHTVTVLWHTSGTQTVSVNYTNPNGCEAATPRTNDITVLPEPTITLTGDLIACEGSSGNVYTTEPGMTNYVWVVSTGGAIVSGGTVNDNTATVKWNTAGPQTISVNYTSADGCTAQLPVSANITVNPKSSPTIDGPTNICAGSGEYTYTTESGMDNYTWAVSAGGTVTGGGTTTDHQITIRWDATGPQTVSVNYENSYGCPDINPAVRNITVSAASTPTITGINEACQGTQRTYTTQSGKTDYHWAVSAGTITAGGTSTDNTVTILWDTFGPQSVSVYYTDATGCTSTTAVEAVTVYTNTQPVITGNFTVCRGTTERYETESGMNNYAWLVSTGGTITSGGTATDNYVMVTWNTTGNKTVSVNYTTPDNCNPATATIQNITVNELPVVTCPENLTVCLTTASFTLTEGTPAGGTFSGTGVTGNTFDPAAAGLGAHTITYAVTDGNSCTNTCTYTITVDPVPSVADQNITICSNELLEVDLDALVPGASFTWTASHISGAGITGFSGCSSSCGNTISQILVNPTYSNQGGSNGTVRYVVTANDNNCTGTFNINVTVRPVLSPRNISWNSNFDQNTYEVCVGGSVLNDNDLDIIPAPANNSYNGLNPQWEYAVTPDGPWLPAPGEWSYQGNYQWTVASELMSQVGTYYFRFSLTDGNGCISSSDIVDVQIISTMVVDAGEPDYTCSSATPSAIPLTGASVGGVLAGGTPSARWSASTGSLSNTSFTTNPAGVSYTPPAGYVGEVTLTLTTNDPSGDCEPLTDTRTIHVLPAGPFENCYSPATWPVTHSNSNGSLTIDCAIDLIGSNNGSESAGTTEIEHCIGTGNVTFDWIFTAPENKLVWHTGDQKSGGRYSTTNSVRVDKPSNLEVGDLIIVTLHFTSNPGTINRPSGFVEIETTTNTYDDDATVASFYKIATAADLGTPGYFTFTANTVGSSTRYLSVRVTGFDESNPIGAERANTANGPPVTNDYRTITLSSINGGSNSLLVAALSVGGTIQYPLSPVGMNTVFYSDAQTAARVAIEEVSGATGDKSFRWPYYGSVNSGSNAASAHMFIINPAPPDTDAGYYLLNGTATLLSSTNGTTGSSTIPVTAGDEIGFRVTTNNNTGGAGELIIFNINLPNDIPVLTGETEILVGGCQEASYTPVFVDPTVTDDCGTPVNKTGYPQTGTITVNGCERTQTRTWVVVDECGDESDPFTQTIRWVETSPIAIICPLPDTLAACTDQATIEAAYNTWKAGFSYTGGCGNVTDNLAAVPVLTDMSCGGEIGFTYTVTDSCGQDVSCTSNFVVLTASDLAVICPADPVLPACSSQAEIAAAYALWVAGFSFTGGCAGVTTNLGEIPVLPDLTCGGQITFTYRADYSTTGCEYAVDCIATFTVAGPEPISITISPDVSLPVCSTTGEIEAAYNNWKAGFTASGGCSLTTNIANIPALPDSMYCGGEISFTLVADNGAGFCTNHAEGTSVFKVFTPPPLTVSCPADPDLPGCSDPAVIANAYNAWVDGFKTAGGCNVVTNIAEIPPLGSLLCEGTLEFTFKAYNGSNVCPDTATCFQTFTIGEAPEMTVTCPPHQVVHGCTPEEVQTDFDNWLAGFGVSGGCNPSSTDLSIFTPPATCGGTHTIDYHVTDECGNTATCSSSFTVEPIDLAVTVPGDAFEAACQSQQDIDIAFADWLGQFGSMGGCGVTTTDLSTFSPPDACGGTIIINYSASDICGQVENGSAVFTIHFPNDVLQDPTFSVPANITLYADAACSYDASPAITGEPFNLADNCGEANLVTTYSDDTIPGSCEGSYVINRNWTVTDNCLTATSHLQVITVEDTIAPVFTVCPASVDNIPADENQCEVATYTLEDPAATDNCTNPVAITWEKTGATTGNGTGTATGPFHVGVTTIIYTATDDCGNTATCTQTVTIKDITQPNLTLGCEDVVEQASANNCSKIPANINDPEYSDDCWPVDSLTLTWVMTGATEGTGYGSVKDSTFQVGVTTVTYTVTDPDGNTATCIFTVTIADITLPNLTMAGCVNVSDTASANNCFKISAKLTDPAYSDPCWDTDSLTLTWVMTGATEGTGYGSVKDSTFQVGVTTVTYTVTDPDGNTATCSFTVTIVDVTPPDIQITGCENVTETAGPNNCYIIPANIDNPSYSDACWDTDSLTLSWVMTGATEGSGTGSVANETFNIGVTTVIYTVADPDGNTATCTFTVTILHEDIPEAAYTCPQDTVYATPSAGECEAYVPLEAPDIDDPCNEIDRYWNNSPYRTDSTHASGTYPVGTTMFNWYISDVSGNTDSCRVVVIVNDLPPTLTCPDDFTVPADFGQSYATNVAIPLPTHGDNCDYILYWGMHGATTDTSAVFNAIDLVPTPYPQLNVGQTTITYYLLDLNGDIITCDFIITVEAAPVIDCPPDTIHYAGAAGCSFLYNPGIPTLVQGAQPIDWKWTLTNPDGTTLTGSSRTPDDGPNPLPVVAAAPHEYDFQLGTTTIEWTATNISGADTCSHTVVVRDTIPPAFTLPLYENCVDPLHSAVYDPANANPLVNHIDPNLLKVPSPDYRMFTSGDTALDLLTLDDNCCDSASMIINWRIEFENTTHPITGDPIIHPNIFGTGQPSKYVDPVSGLPADIYLWGDGVFFSTVVHRIFYQVEDCNGNVSKEFSEVITITPRPKIEKLN